MLYYLVSVLLIYAAFLATRQRERRARQAFAARLGALYRVRSEFWRVRVWAQEARERGDADALARFGRQAEALVARATGESTQLRRDDPRLALELGWSAGLLDEELADMGHAVSSPELRGYERWITGRGRTPVESILNPRPAMEDDALSGRIQLVLGMIVGAICGFVAWMITYRAVVVVPMWTLALYMGIGAAALGHIAWDSKGRLWGRLFEIERHPWVGDLIRIFR